MKPSPARQATRPDAISALVPYAHVADVERSLAFYSLMGFVRRETHSGPTGRVVWAHAVSGDARLMLAQSSGPIAADQQAVLFYMHCTNVAALRTRLLQSGVHNGGAYDGKPRASNSGPVLFDIAFPFYMPAGEFRLHDPDGYVILVGQLT